MTESEAENGALVTGLSALIPFKSRPGGGTSRGLGQEVDAGVDLGAALFERRPHTRDYLVGDRRGAQRLRGLGGDPSSPTVLLLTVSCVGEHSTSSWRTAASSQCGGMSVTSLLSRPRSNQRFSRCETSLEVAPGRGQLHDRRTVRDGP